MPAQSEYGPEGIIVLKESSAPHTYRFGKEVIYVTKSGTVLDPDVVGHESRLVSRCIYSLPVKVIP